MWNELGTSLRKTFLPRCQRLWVMESFCIYVFSCFLLTDSPGGFCRLYCMALMHCRKRISWTCYCAIRGIFTYGSGKGKSKHFCLTKPQEREIQLTCSSNTAFLLSCSVSLSLTFLSLILYFSSPINLSLPCSLLLPSLVHFPVLVAFSHGSFLRTSFFHVLLSDAIHVKGTMYWKYSMHFPTRGWLHECHADPVVPIVLTLNLNIAKTFSAYMLHSCPRL